MRRLFNTKNKLLNELIKKSHKAGALGQRLHHYLDPELAKHCQVTSLQRGCLTISVNSAAWATQFRYAQPQLLKQLRTEEKLYNLRNIKCVVTPPCTLLPSAATKSKRQLSSGSAEVILDAAKKIKNESLKAALKKLALCVDH